MSKEQMFPRLSPTDISPATHRLRPSKVDLDLRDLIVVSLSMSLLSARDSYSTPRQPSAACTEPPGPSSSLCSELTPFAVLPIQVGSS